MRKIISIQFESIKEISAIYYALLQNGYSYYRFERSDEHISHIQKYAGSTNRFTFFEKVAQNTCEVYPFWPRAAILETAVFYLDGEENDYFRFNEFHEKIMSAGNISDRERDQNLWRWIADYPQALKEVMDDQGFQHYYEFEKAWLQREYEQHQDVLLLQNLLQHKIFTDITDIDIIQLVINPIKCVYSADFHIVNGKFVYSSGCFRLDSVIHEMLHLAIHPLVEKHKKGILSIGNLNLKLDPSYYLDGDDQGRLNAFEEAVVRSLTKKVIDNENVESAEGSILQIMRSIENS